MNYKHKYFDYRNERSKALGIIRKSEQEVVSNLHQEVVDYANQNQLTIVHMECVKDGITSTVGVSVIFAKQSEI